MPSFSYDVNGNEIQHTQYTNRGVGTLIDIFPKSKDVGKLLVKKDKTINVRKEYGNVERVSDVVRLVFYDFMLMVLDRVAYGDIFILPGQTKANITLKPLPDDDVKRLRQRGFYKEIDILKSNFKIPYFAWDFGPNNIRSDRRIKVHKASMTKALKNAEDRKLPWAHLRKTRNYADRDR
ncbi:MAG: hypothetical protein KAS32_18895 [Candidatus Peribacteraceae bacterium]|nr:hypothetical protein [Candidatus Peribacteraceae bacterium]